MDRQGKLVAQSGVIYEGKFQHGIMRGKAIITYPDGVDIKSYDGDTEYGLPHGKGTKVVNAKKYEGDFWYGVEHGRGILTISGTTSTFNGKWIYGRFKWPEQNGITFWGSINNIGKRAGKGFCKTTAQHHIEYCSFTDDMRDTPIIEK